MDRARIFELIDVAHGRGLEIGALDHPIVTRAMGPVEYVDRASQAELQAEYVIHAGVDPKAIVPVDHVWGEQSLLECVGGRRTYDYVVASHVIEHVPDLLGWLREIAAVLVDGGLAVFLVPDKRYTFDMLRRPSGGAEMVDAYVRGLRRPDARQLFDCFHYFHHPVTGVDRDGHEKSEAVTTRRARELLEVCRRIQTSGEYIDAHCWVFTPKSMVEALDLASRFDLLAFEIAELVPTGPGSNEFLLALRRLPDDLGAEARRAAFAAGAGRLDLPCEVDLTDGEPAQARPAPEALAELEARAQHAIARAAAIEASTSWRITAPLRAAVDWTRRLRRRATSA